MASTCGGKAGEAVVDGPDDKIGPVWGDAGVCGEDGVVNAGTAFMSTVPLEVDGAWKRYESCQDNASG